MRTEHFRRYQLNKQTSATVAKRHPWIYSGQMSTAVETFQDSEMLRLVDTDNKTVGFGIYCKDDRIAIRVFHFGEQIRNRFFFKRLREVVEKRLELMPQTDAIRLVNGEIDGFPGVTVDRYGSTAVVLYYATGLYPLARMVSMLLPHAAEMAQISNILVRPATKTGQFIEIPPRITRGAVEKELIIEEFGLKYSVDVRGGQKGGFFLDLRGARRYLSGLNLSGMRVLNLFAYTGAFSLIAAKQGAKEVYSVEQSQLACKTFMRNIALNGQDLEKHKLIQADVFDWIETLPAQEKFDLILIDPPSLATKDSQIPTALNKMESLHLSALKHLNPDSQWISCSCTRRLEREPLLQSIGKASKTCFGKGRTKIVEEIPVEPDHGLAPKGFSEGNYLQVFVFSNAG